MPDTTMMSAGTRVSTSAVLGAVVGAAAAFVMPWQAAVLGGGGTGAAVPMLRGRVRLPTMDAPGAARAAVLGGWDPGAAFLMLRVWMRIRTMDGPETARAAGPTDLSRRVADPILTTASIGCLVGVGFTLLKASEASGAGKALLVAIAV